MDALQSRGDARIEKQVVDAFKGFYRVGSVEIVESERFGVTDTSGEDFGRRFP